MRIDISAKNFFKNLSQVNVNDRTLKTTDVIKITGLPKETVRRKIKRLCSDNFLIMNKDKSYYYNFMNKKKDIVKKIISNETIIQTKFVSMFANKSGLLISYENIKKEIESKFSFFRYHYLGCQLEWMRMWQSKLNDIDLIFIAIQAIMPTLKYTKDTIKTKKIRMFNFHKIVGDASNDYRLSDSSINASSVSEISGIPRVTCIRKLNKLVSVGLLIKDIKTRRYYVNQNASKRTQFFLKQEHIIVTINSFSNLLALIIKELSRNK